MASCSLVVSLDGSPADDLGMELNWTTDRVLPFQYYLLSTSFLAHLSAACWLLCNYVDTLYDEVIYVWKRRICLGSILFFAVRYIGMICLGVSFAVCIWPRQIGFDYRCSDGSLPPKSLEYFTFGTIAQRVVTRFVPPVEYLTFWVVSVIMQMRIYALYKNKALAVANGVFFLGEVVAMSILWHMAPFFTLMSLAWYFDHDTGFIAVPPALPAAYWSPAIAFELWMAILAVVKMRRAVLKRDLLGVILGDSLIYFLMVLCLMVTHLVLTLYNYGSFVSPFVIAGESIAGSQLVLHLRKAYYARCDGASTGASMGNISFAVPVQTPAACSSRVVDASFYDDE